VIFALYLYSLHILNMQSALANQIAMAIINLEEGKPMSTNTIILENSEDILTVTINRAPHHNSINAELLTELHRALNQAEADPTCHAMVIQGKEGFFCTGMDFQELTQDIAAEKSPSISAPEYMSLLKRFTLSPKFIISKVDGRVLAGGMGIVAASDFVLSSPKSQFGLSEAMWGLLPANVMPFLIRRIGFQPAYAMTLTARDITAARASELHLVDEIHDNLDDGLRRLLINLRRVSSSTVAEAKQFFRKMWVLDETMENIAIQELEKLIAKPDVLNNVSNYVLHQKFPWEK
jgi:polyketide biosynthesis enoyl-CoA hydratase PksH